MARRTTSGPVRAVLFDLDDTLFDHRRALEHGIAALRATDPLLSRQPLARLVDRYQRLLDGVAPGAPGAPPTIEGARLERFRRLRVALGGPDDLDAARAWSARYRAEYQAARRLVPGTLPLLRAVHPRALVGVVTNNQTLEQVGKLRHLGLERWIDFLVTSEAVGHSKPDPRIFELALYRAGCGPREAVMVGDSWATDIVGAARAGIPAVWLRRGGPSTGGRLRGVREIRSFFPTRATADLLLSGTIAPPEAVRVRPRRPNGS